MYYYYVMSGEDGKESSPPESAPILKVRAATSVLIKKRVKTRLDATQSEYRKAGLSAILPSAL